MGSHKILHCLGMAAGTLLLVSGCEKPEPETTEPAEPVSSVIKMHASQPGPEFSQDVPDGWKHASEPGPDQSRYFPPDWKHAAEAGADNSRYFPPDWKHSAEDTFQNSKYVPGDWKHITEDGPEKTVYVPPHWVHNPDTSTYAPPRVADCVGGIAECLVVPVPDTADYYPEGWTGGDEETTGNDGGEIGE